MSDSLDKLKALSSKLEKKLQAKKQKSLFELSSETETTATPENDTIAPETTPKTKPDIASVRTQTVPASKTENRKTQTSASRENETPSVDTRVRSVSEKTTDTGATSDKAFESVREENLSVLRRLYTKLHIHDKVPEFERLFIYKAMNLSGIGLKEEDFGQIREGKYIQIITITYEPDKNGKKKAKNISLGYFGKAETIDETLKNDIVEFVLRWRYEKAFQNVDHYKALLAKVVSR